MGFPREFGKIQKQHRIALPKTIRERLGWEVGDQVMIEIYRDKFIMVENLSASWRKQS